MVNKSMIEIKLKILFLFFFNVSDSKDALDRNKSILKGGTMTAI